MSLHRTWQRSCTGAVKAPIAPDHDICLQRGNLANSSDRGPRSPGNAKVATNNYATLQAIAYKNKQPDKANEIEVKELDLASLESVRGFVRAFNRENRRLDVLICNAGIMAPPERQQTADGLEMQFQVSTHFYSSRISAQ